MDRPLLKPCFMFGLSAIVLACSSPRAVAQDVINGGRMYDKWWVVNGADEPTGDHPLYPPFGQRSGSTTFRCKECHGWDYKGVDGAYGLGSSHFTGIPGVLESTMTPAEMFDIIKNPNGDGTGGTTVNGHDFGTIGLADSDIDDIVEFLQTALLDPDLFLDGAVFVGDETQGETNYTGLGACYACHGNDGTAINFGTPEEPEWVGTVAVENPWEFMHKVRFGQPGSIPQMPGWIEGGGSDQGVADIGVYVQLNFPVGLDADGDGVIDGDDLCNNTPPGIPVDDQGRPLGDLDLDCDTDLHDFAAFQDSFTGLVE